MMKYALLLSMTNLVFSMSPPPQDAAPDAPWLAGVGIADCTGPAAEVVMMGYADSGHKTAGIHMRLYARAFIFIDPNSHERMAFVNVDTWAATEMIIQGVEEKLQAWFQGRYYSRNNLIIAGSHTHQGPAGASAYMLFQFSSMGRVQQSLDALVDGISEAIWLAHHNVKEAHIYMGNGLVDNSTVPNCPMPNCASRNRSPTSFAKNPEELRKKYFGEDNVDRNMDLLRIVDAKTGKAMGSLNWFAVHPTSMNSDYNLISGDNKGYAAYAFEQEMNGPTWVQPAGRGPFVAGFAQGVSGDISPNTKGDFCKHTNKSCESQWSVCYENGQMKNSLCVAKGPAVDPYRDPKDRYESMKVIGERQATAAKTIFERATTPLGGGIGYVLRYVDLSKYWVDTTGNGTWVQTCRPTLGTSFAAGTTDGPSGMNMFAQNMTPSNNFLTFVANVISLPTAEDHACQAPKKILLRPNQIGETVFPTVLGFQMMRLGKLIVAAVPGEFTTMAGKLTQEAIKKVLVERGMENITVVLNNVASGYAGYVTTLEEYQHQRYEGGFTTYGPNTHAAMTDVLVQMAEDLADGKQTYPGVKPALPTKEESWQNPLTVIADAPPIGGKFGDIYQDVSPGPHWPGATVRCRLWGAHPRNHLQRNSSFGTIWLWQPTNASDPSSGGQWKLAADDSDFDTMFHWKREGISASIVTIDWNIPDHAPAGWYTIHYSGHAREAGQVSAISGACGLFEVRESSQMAPTLPDQFVVPPPQSVDVPDMPLRRPRRPRGPPGLRGRGLKEAETESRHESNKWI